MRALGDNYVCRCKTGAAGVPIDLLDGYLNSESSKLTPRLARAPVCKARAALALDGPREVRPTPCKTRY